MGARAGPPREQLAASVAIALSEASATTRAPAFTARWPLPCRPGTIWPSATLTPLLPGSLWPRSSPTLRDHQPPW